MFGLGGTESWFGVLDKTVASWVGIATKPFHGGFVNGLETVVGGAWEAGKAAPYATAVTLGIGAVTLYAYKNRGFGVGLGNININLDSFLAHFNLSTGLGRSKADTCSNIEQKLYNLEAGLNALRYNETQHYRETVENLATVTRGIQAQNTNSRTLQQQISDGFQNSQKALTIAFDQAVSKFNATQKSTLAIAGESAENASNQVMRRP